MTQRNASVRYRSRCSWKRLTAISISHFWRHFREYLVLSVRSLVASGGKGGKETLTTDSLSSPYFSSRVKLDRVAQGQKKYTVRGVCICTLVSFFARIGNSESAFVFFNVSASNAKARARWKMTMKLSGRKSPTLIYGTFRPEVKPRLNLLFASVDASFDLRRESYIFSIERIERWGNEFK